jgi:hypothetical protein
MKRFSPEQQMKIGIDFEIKIADRFRNENRSAIFPEQFLIAIVIANGIKKSGSGLKMEIADRL